MDPDNYSLASDLPKHLNDGDEGIMPVQEVVHPIRSPKGLQVTLVHLHEGFPGARVQQRDLDQVRYDCL